MPLPPGARVGTLPDGSLTWLDAQGNAINADGSPVTGAPQAQPLQAQPNTAPAPLPGPSATPTTPAPTTAPGPLPTATTATAAPGMPAGPTVPGTTQPQQPPVPGLAGNGAVGTPGGNDQVDAITAQARQEISDANAQVTQAYTALNGLQSQYAQETDPLKQQQLSAQITASYSQLGSAEQRVATANAAYSSTLTKALDQVTVSPEQANLYNAQAGAAKAQADYSNTQADVLAQGSEGQRQLVAAQAGQAAANGQAALLTAQAAVAKTPAEAAALNAQAAQSTAQANQINTLLPGLVQKQQAETGLTQAQTDLTGSQSDYYKALSSKTAADANLSQAQADTARATLAAGGPQATVTATLAQATANQATAQQTLENITKQKLGPVYGLQDQINAAIPIIQQHVFGPGGTGDPSQANDLLQQFVTSTIGGTTPFEASKAAAAQQGINYGTQMAGVNALQSAQATRAGQFANLAGGALGTLEQMNAYAPKGSTAMAGAFQSVLDYMGNKLAQPQFAPVNIPQAPPMPSFLQGFAQGNTIGQQQGAAQASAQGQGQQPTVNVNVNGQPQGPGAGAAFNPAAAGPAIPTNAQAPAPYAGAPSPYATPSPISYPSTAGAPPTPAQSFAQGLASNQGGNYPNVLSMYGLNMPNPTQMLGGQTYAGMPLR